ncbi:hypothetical protein ACJX0J_021384 [Zea mays]
MANGFKWVWSPIFVFGGPVESFAQRTLVTKCFIDVIYKEFFPSSIYLYKTLDNRQSHNILYVIFGIFLCVHILGMCYICVYGGLYRMGLYFFCWYLLDAGRRMVLPEIMLDRIATRSMFYPLSIDIIILMMKA